MKAKVSKLKKRNIITPEGKTFKYIFNNEININLNLSPLKVAAQLFDFNNFPFVIIYTGRSLVFWHCFHAYETIPATPRGAVINYQRVDRSAGSNGRSMKARN